MSPLSATTDGRSQGFVNECLFVVHNPDTDTEIVTDGFVTHFLLTCTACYSLIQSFVAYILQNTNLHQHKNVWTDAIHPHCTLTTRVQPNFWTTYESNSNI